MDIGLQNIFVRNAVKRTTIKRVKKIFLIESEQRRNETVLHVFSRDRNNVKKVETVKTFKPYFFVPKTEEVPDDWRITGIKSGFKSILGKPLKKIFVKKFMDVPEVSSLFKEHYEADIRFPLRYLIDEIGEIEPYPLKILYLDIETNSNNIFPDIENANQEVISICMIDSFENKQVKLILENNKWHPEMTKHLRNKSCFICKDEEKLLNKFIQELINYDPDVISGFNVSDFDLTYLINRMTKLNVDYNKLSPLGTVYINEIYKDVKIKGRVILDMMKSYKHFRGITNQGKAESYSLEYTAQEVLKKGKIEHSSNFSEMWLNEPDKLIEYNLMDVLLVKELNDKLKIIEFFNQLRCKACAQLESVFQTSVLIDCLLLNKLHNKLVLPSKKKNNEDTFKGAYVALPEIGIYENVLGLDIRGLYPNIITTFNIGYSTFNPNGEIKISKGVGFNKGTGIISQVIKELGIERDKLKKLRNNSKTEQEYEIYDWKQYGMKIFQNSIFGWIGFPKSRLYKKEVAEAITGLGRKIIKWTATVLKNRGYKVLMSDTDSCFFEAKTSGLIENIIEGKQLANLINKTYIDFAKSFGSDECTLEIEFEKIFKKIMFVPKKSEEVGAKKKYAYILSWKDGKAVRNKVECVGFSAKKSNVPRIAREIQKNVLELIFNGNSKEEVITFLESTEKLIRRRKIPDNEFSFPGEINKEPSSYGKIVNKENGRSYKSGVPPVIQGCRYSNKFLGTRFTKGMRLYWTYLKSVPLGYPETKVITFVDKIPEGFIPDIDLINEKIFKDKLTEIFKSAGFGEFPVLNINQKINRWL